MPWNPASYGLPLPPNQRSLSAVRNSPVRALLARFRSAGNSIIPPQVKPPVPRQFVPGRQFTPISPDLKKTRTVRDALGLISACARQGQMVRIIYRRLKDGAIVQRTVEPYSLRYRRTKRGGRARYFYAYDSGEGNPTRGIHSFRMSNIMGVEQTNRPFTPRWKVEF